MTSVLDIHDLVRTGRCTPEDGALLLYLRERLQWARKPWWEKALIVLAKVVFE